MPKYIIERNVPGAGKLSQQELTAMSNKSCDVLRELGPEVQWRESYVVDDKIFCVYYAKDERIVREHAKRGGFPADHIYEVRNVIDPSTAEKR
jgi:hypothetical protein